MRTMRATALHACERRASRASCPSRETTLRYDAPPFAREHMSLFARGLVSTTILAAALSASSCFGPTNPFDPATPALLQAKASLRGRVVLGAAPVGDTRVDDLQRVTVKLVRAS